MDQWLGPRAGQSWPKFPKHAFFVTSPPEITPPKMKNVFFRFWLKDLCWVRCTSSTWNVSRFWNTNNKGLHLFHLFGNQTQQILIQFDRQYNFTMEMIKNYEYYQMQVRHVDSLLLRLVDQLELITDTNGRLRLSHTMTALSKKASTAERSQLWIRTIIERHVQTSRSNLERYYVSRTIQQSLSALNKITDLHRDIIYQHQFWNGKIISFPKYRIVDHMTTTKELLTTMPSSTFADVTTSSTPAVITIQITTQTILTTTKE